MIQYTTLQAVAGCTTQYEKIKAIMAFVADRTYYDYYAYYNNKPSYWSPYEVYEQKRAMCSGYASLMKMDFCRCYMVQPQLLFGR